MSVFNKLKSGAAAAGTAVSQKALRGLATKVGDDMVGGHLRNVEDKIGGAVADVKTRAGKAAELVKGQASITGAKLSEAAKARLGASTNDIED